MNPHYVESAPRPHRSKGCPRALVPRTTDGQAVAEPRFPARARAGREDLSRRQLVHSAFDERNFNCQVSGDTLRAMSAALVLSEPLTHRALDHVVSHRSSVLATGIQCGRPWWGNRTAKMPTGPASLEQSLAGSSPAPAAGGGVLVRVGGVVHEQAPSAARPGGRRARGPGLRGRRVAVSSLR